MMNSQRWVSVLALISISVLSLSCPSVQHKEIKQNTVVETVKQDKTFNFIYKSYPVSVNYNLSLNEMVMAGKYDLMNDSDIRIENLSATTKSSVNVELYLIHLNRVITDVGVIQYLDVLGLKPAKIEHLLAFGAKYPSKQLDFPIVALGSNVIDPLGRHYTSYLDTMTDVRGQKRLLYLFSEVEPNNSWSENCRFLAVRK